MNEIKVAENKTLKLTNVLSRLVRPEELGNLPVILTQMQNFMKSNGAQPIGPLVQAVKMGTGPDHVPELYMMQQATQMIPQMEPGYHMDAVLRLYVLFMGDYEKAAPWSDSSVKGCKRFVDRIWALQDKVTDSDSYSDALRSKMHKTIKKVSEDIESMKFNTAIAAMMTLLNDIYDAGSITRKEFRDLLVLLYPFAPHVSEELYQLIGCEGVLSEQEWVTYDEAQCVDDTIEIVVQINGKVRAKLEIPADAEKDAVLAQAAAEPKVSEAIAGKTIIKQIYVPKKLVNFVVK